MNARLDTSKLAPGTWFVRAGRYSRGVWPVAPEGRRVVAIFIGLTAAALVVGITLYAVTRDLPWLAVSLVGLIGAAIWFAAVSTRHLDRPVRYRDLKMKSPPHA